MCECDLASNPVRTGASQLTFQMLTRERECRHFYSYDPLRRIASLIFCTVTMFCIKVRRDLTRDRHLCHCNNLYVQHKKTHILGCTRHIQDGEKDIYKMQNETYTRCRIIQRMQKKTSPGLIRAIKQDSSQESCSAGWILLCRWILAWHFIIIQNPRNTFVLPIVVSSFVYTKRRVRRMSLGYKKHSVRSCHRSDSRQLVGVSSSQRGISGLGGRGCDGNADSSWASFRTAFRTIYTVNLCCHPRLLSDIDGVVESFLVSSRIAFGSTPRSSPTWHGNNSERRLQIKNLIDYGGGGVPFRKSLRNCCWLFELSCLQASCSNDRPSSANPSSINQISSPLASPTSTSSAMWKSPRVVSLSEMSSLPTHTRTC